MRTVHPAVDSRLTMGIALLVVGLLWLGSADGVLAQQCEPNCPLQDFCCSNCLCDPGEDRELCPADCRFGCNYDEVCEPEAHETHGNCPSDCPAAPPTCNNDGFCDPPGETPQNCSNDCSVDSCGNGWIDPGEDCDSCPVDLAARPTFTVVPLMARVGEEITAAASGVRDPPSPLWDMGDATHLPGNPVTHTYASPGTYNVRLTASEAACGLTRTVGPVAVNITPGPPPPPPGNQPPHANPGGPYAGAQYKAIVFNGSSSTDPEGSHTLATFTWDFGDETSGTGRIVQHVYAREGTFTVRLTVRDNGGLTDVADTVATISAAAPDGRFNTSQSIVYSAASNEMVASASMVIHPPDSYAYKPVLRAIAFNTAGIPNDLGFNDGSVLRTFSLPGNGFWRLRVDYYFASLANPSQRQLVESRDTLGYSGGGTPPENPPPPTGPAPRISGPNVLWYFGGGAGGLDQPTTIELSVFPFATACTWQIDQGADKVAFEGTACLGARLTSRRPSFARNDVWVSVIVDGRRSDPHRVSVLKPHSARFLYLTDFSIFGGYDTRIYYQVEDQLGDPVKNIWVEEDFTTGQVVDWTGPETPSWGHPTISGAFWPDGVFWDRVTVGQCIPPTCVPGAVGPNHPQAGRPVRHYGQALSAGTIARIRFQTNVQQWYLGKGRHEAVVSPVP